MKKAKKDAAGRFIPIALCREITPAHWNAKQRSRFFYLLRKAAKSPDTCKLMFWNSDPWGRSSGVRVWIVAMHGPRNNTANGDKFWCRRREVVGEVLPAESNFDLRVAVRLGVKALASADLRGANLQRANLYDADLRGADLQRADLQRADLWGADLLGTIVPGRAFANAWDVDPKTGIVLGPKS